MGACSLDVMRTEFDTFSDFIPGLSTLTNLTNFFEVHCCPGLLNAESHYYKHIKRKSDLITFLLCVPIINIFAAIYLHSTCGKQSEPTSHAEIWQEMMKEDRQMWSEVLKKACLRFEDIPLDPMKRTESDLEKIDPSTVPTSMVVGLTEHGWPYVLFKGEWRFQGSNSTIVFSFRCTIETLLTHQNAKQFSPVGHWSWPQQAKGHPIQNTTFENIISVLEKRSVKLPVGTFEWSDFRS